MSKRINVNPDHYKTAGRERPNAIAQARQSRTVARNRPKPAARRAKGGPKRNAKP